MLLVRWQGALQGAAPSPSVSRKPAGVCCPEVSSPSIPHLRRFLLKPASPLPATSPLVSRETGSVYCCLFCPVKLLSLEGLLLLLLLPFAALISLAWKSSAGATPPTAFAAPALLSLDAFLPTPTQCAPLPAASQQQDPPGLWWLLNSPVLVCKPLQHPVPAPSSCVSHRSSVRPPSGSSALLKPFSSITNCSISLQCSSPQPGD